MENWAAAEDRGQTCGLVWGLVVRSGAERSSSQGLGRTPRRCAARSCCKAPTRRGTCSVARSACEGVRAGLSTIAGMRERRRRRRLARTAQAVACRTGSGRAACRRAMSARAARRDRVARRRACQAGGCTESRLYDGELWRAGRACARRAENENTRRGARG